MALFKRLQAIYGVRWDDQFPSEARHDAALVEWGLGLVGLSGEQIKRGIEKCRTGCDWPPSIAQFVRFACAADECWEHRGLAYRPHVKALPKPKANPDLVKGQLVAMREALRGRAC